MAIDDGAHVELEKWAKELAQQCDALKYGISQLHRAMTALRSGHRVHRPLSHYGFYTPDSDSDSSREKPGSVMIKGSISEILMSRPTHHPATDDFEWSLLHLRGGEQW